MAEAPACDVPGRRALLLKLLKPDNIDTTHFSREQVFLYPPGVGKVGLSGTLSFLSYRQKCNAEVDVMYLCWVPDSLTHARSHPPHRANSGPADAGMQEMGVRGPAEEAAAAVADPELLWSYAIAILAHDLVQFQRQYDSGCQTLTLQTRQGQSYGPLYFRKGGVRTLVHQLGRRMHVERVGPAPFVFTSVWGAPLAGSNMEGLVEGAYRVTPVDPTLQRSLHQLQMDNYVEDTLQRQGMTSLLSWGSRVTRRVRETTEAWFGQPTEPSSLLEAGDRDAIESLLGAAPAKEGWTVVQGPTPQTSVVGSAQSSGPRQVDWEPVTRARPPVTAEEWHASFDSAGRVLPGKWAALCTAIFEGGLEPAVRATAWPFLVGLYSPDTTVEHRAELRSQRAVEYATLKQQWQSISAAQAARFSAYRECRGRIEKDVVRTDRTYAFYDDEAHLRMLHDILLTHSFYDFDLGYCQGMGDLASPLLMLLGDEAEAFWCFARTMDVVGGNFRTDGVALSQQLAEIGRLLAVVDPPLAGHLQAVDASHLFCCFRWVLVRFRREFAYPAILMVWEALWTAEAAGRGPCYHLWMCVCLLHRQRHQILDTHMSADDLLRYANDLSGHLDAAGLVVHTAVLAAAYENLIPAPEGKVGAGEGSSSATSADMPASSPLFMW